MNNKDDIYKIDDDEDDYEEEPKKTVTTTTTTTTYSSSKKDDDDDDDEKKSGLFSDDLKGKLIKYGIIVFIVLIALLLLVALFFPKGSKKNSDTAVEKAITLNTGDKYALDYSKGTYTWTSSNQNVAKISSKGEIEAIKNGDATITIKVGNETIAYKVHVDKVDDAVVLTNVKMEKNTIELEKDKEYKMTVTLTPKTATNAELTWSSSNEKVATVKDGVITAVAPGTCIVTVKSTNGNIDNCVVKVKGDGNYNPVEDITIESEDVSLNKGTSYIISYKADPEDSINLITWESSDDEVATVENGIIYALKGGEIKVTAKSGDISKTIDVKVVDDTPVDTRFMLNQYEMTLKIGDSYTLVPSNTEIKLAWVSSNINVATVDGSGKVVAKAEGTAVITAKTEEGYYADCTVTVTKKETQDTISLNSSSLSMNVGDKVRLIETVTPSNNVSNVTWSSSNANVATVTNGEVTAVSAGTTTITAKLPNGAKAECVVNVSSKVIKVSQVVLNVRTLSMSIGATNQLTATVKPSNATNKSITWSSSNPSVVSVDSNGKITALKQGTAKIYAKADNGVFDECGVIVR